MSSSQSAVRYELFVGVDIAAATASAVWQPSANKPGKAITIEQTPEGFTVLQRSLSLTHVAPNQVLVVMEATGTGFSLPGHVSGPAGVCRECYQSCTGSLFCPHPCTGEPAPDAIDAQTLAQLAALLQPEPWTPPPSIYEELEQRLAEAGLAVSDTRSTAQPTACFTTLPGRGCPRAHPHGSLG
jgi:hypothetical protein